MQIGGQGLEVLKEGAARAELGPDEPVAFIGQFQQGVQAKSQQVHRHEQTGQMLFAMTKVVLQMIALGLEHIVVFVLDLPTRPPGGHPPGHVVGADVPVGDEAVAVKHQPLGAGDRHLAPVDLERVVAVGQGHPVSPAIAMMFPAVGTGP